MRQHAAAVVVFFAFAGAASYLPTARVFEDRFWNEDEVRVQPVRESLAIIPEGSVVLTFDPILFSLFGSGAYHVVDLAGIGTLLEGDRLREVSSGRDAFLVMGAAKEDQESDVRRYPEAFAIIEEYDWVEIGRVGEGDGERVLLKAARTRFRD